MITSRRITLAAIFTALGVALSLYPGAIPAGPTRVLPYQHMINVLSGILLGPWMSGGIALAIGFIRIGMGTGSPFAIPGGVPGALVVGIAYHYWQKKYRVGLLEPMGTGLGALISAFIVAPLLPLIGREITPFKPLFGFTEQWMLFLISFLASSIPGSILGFVVITALERRGVITRLSLR